MIEQQISLLLTLHIFFLASLIWQVISILDVFEKVESTSSIMLIFPKGILFTKTFWGLMLLGVTIGSEIYFISSYFQDIPLLPYEYIVILEATIANVVSSAIYKRLQNETNKSRK